VAPASRRCDGNDGSTFTCITPARRRCHCVRAESALNRIGASLQDGGLGVYGIRLPAPIAISPTQAARPPGKRWQRSPKGS